MCLLGSFTHPETQLTISLWEAWNLMSIIIQFNSADLKPLDKQ